MTPLAEITIAELHFETCLQIALSQFWKADVVNFSRAPKPQGFAKDTLHLLRMRPGKYDRKHQLLITGAELRELKELDLAESFGLDRRIERYEGKRPLGLYRWDLECLVESLSMVLDGRYYGELPSKRRPTVQRLHDRLRAEYDSAYGQDRDVSG